MTMPLSQPFPWDSASITPGSMVYPPDNQDKWHARRNLPGTQMVVSLQGKEVCIAELRGWLRKVETVCNAADPDWHYDLEIDPKWMDNMGINLAEFIRPGDLLRANTTGIDGTPASVRRLVLPPVIHIELDAWPRKPTDQRGNPSLPSDWTFKNECPEATWPFNPKNPISNQCPLAVGDYVRVVGSLVTDHPHEQEGQWYTNLVLRIGYTQTLALHGSEKAAMGAQNAAKWLWMESRPSSDPDNPARWNEIHPPDTIEILDPKDPEETVYVVAIVAQNGLFAGDVESVGVDIAPPSKSPPTLNHKIGYIEDVGRETDFSTVKDGKAVVTVLHDRINVRVTVQGNGGMGGSGKFFAVYRVFWKETPPPPPSLSVRVQPYPVPLGRQVQLTVYAQAAATQTPVSGKVRLHNFDARGRPSTVEFDTNTPFSITLRRKVIRNPRTGQVEDVESPTGTVSVPGYQDAPIDFGL